MLGAQLRKTVSIFLQVSIRALTFSSESVATPQITLALFELTHGTRVKEKYFSLFWMNWHFDTRPEAIVNEFVASSHKWTQRPLTLNETQMKTPSRAWSRLLEADIVLHSDPTGRWRSLIFSFLTHVKLGHLVLCLFPPSHSRNQKDLPAGTRSRKVKVSALSSEHTERVQQVLPCLSPWAWLSGSCAARKSPRARLSDAIIYCLAGWATHPHPPQPNAAHLRSSSSNQWRTCIAPNCWMTPNSSSRSILCHPNQRKFKWNKEKKEKHIFQFLRSYSRFMENFEI